MIGKSVVFVIVSLFLGTFAMAQPLTGIAPEITSPALSSVNKEYPRSEFMTYPKREMAFENDYEKSVYYQSLDGEWKFKYVEDSRDLREEYHARFIMTVRGVGLMFPEHGKTRGFVSWKVRMENMISL